MVDGLRFHGKGKDRRIAKTKAAQAALTQLFEMDFSNHHVDSIPYIPIVTDDQQVGNDSFCGCLLRKLCIL